MWLPKIFCFCDTSRLCHGFVTASRPQTASCASSARHVLLCYLTGVCVCGPSPVVSPPAPATLYPSASLFFVSVKCPPLVLSRSSTPAWYPCLFPTHTHTLKSSSFAICAACTQFQGSYLAYKNIFLPLSQFIFMLLLSLPVLTLWPTELSSSCFAERDSTTNFPLMFDVIWEVQLLCTIYWHKEIEHQVEEFHSCIITFSFRTFAGLFSVFLYYKGTGSHSRDWKSCETYNACPCSM